MKNFVTLALAGAASALESDGEFMEFLATHGRMVGTVEEYNFRKDLFTATHEFIQEHNASGSLFRLGHNHMSDWTEEEYSRVRSLTPEADREVSEGTEI